MTTYKRQRAPPFVEYILMCSVDCWWLGALSAGPGELKPPAG